MIPCIPGRIIGQVRISKRVTSKYFIGVQIAPCARMTSFSFEYLADCQRARVMAAPEICESSYKFIGQNSAKRGGKTTYNAVRNVLQTAYVGATRSDVRSLPLSRGNATCGVGKTWSPK